VSAASGSELEKYIFDLEIADKNLEDETLAILKAEGVSLKQVLDGTVTDTDLQEIGVPEPVRELIRSATQAFPHPAHPVSPHPPFPHIQPRPLHPESPATLDLAPTLAPAVR
jgi:hypothetical protein